LLFIVSIDHIIHHDWKVVVMYNSRQWVPKRDVQVLVFMCLICFKSQPFYSSFYYILPLLKELSLRLYSNIYQTSTASLPTIHFRILRALKMWLLAPHANDSSNFNYLFIFWSNKGMYLVSTPFMWQEGSFPHRR
jgi:hypothetical protein